MIDKRNIPIKYKIPLQGIMNKGVSDCFKCNTTPIHRKHSFIVVEDILGFSDSQWGKMVVWQCRHCGQKYFFHLREWDTMTNVDYVKWYHEYVTTGSWNY